MIKRQWFIAGVCIDSDGVKYDFSSIVSVSGFFSNASMAMRAVKERLKQDGVEAESIIIRSMNRA